MQQIKAIRMPKWGLAMEEGTVVAWLKQVGDMVAEGDEILEIETTKITNVLEATNSGRLARIVAGDGEVMPVGALIGVLVEGAVSDAEIDAFVDAAPPAVEMAEAGEAPGEALAQQMVDAGGRRVNVATAGSGRPMVFLHGYAGDFNSWLFALEDLKSAGRVIAPDLPGHGGSAKDVGDGSLATLSAAMAATLAALGVEDAVVVGHSLGCAVAMRLALDHPALVRRLVLVCPAGLPGTAVSDGFLSAMAKAERARDVKQALQLLVRDPSTISRDMVDGVVRFVRLDGAREALETLRTRMLDGGDFTALQERLDDLPPTTVITTPHDGIVGSPDAAALPAGWTLVTIENAGHLPHLEAAAEVNAILRELI